MTAHAARTAEDALTAPGYDDPSALVAEMRAAIDAKSAKAACESADEWRDSLKGALAAGAETIGDREMNAIQLMVWRRKR
jgi:hypothetical protein